MIAQAKMVYSGDPPPHVHGLDWSGPHASEMIVRCMCGRYFLWTYPNVGGDVNNTWVRVRWYHRTARRRIRDWEVIPVPCAVERS